MCNVVRSIARFALTAVCLVVLAGVFSAAGHAQDANASGRHPAAGNSTSASARAPAGSPISDDNYHLGTGDKLRVTVYGETDLSGEFLVDGSGQVQLPLVGQVKAAGLTVNEFVAQVTHALKDGYLKDPKVSVEVLNYRPFYIMGEVNKPGEYPYESGLNVLGAVALAGGYTYRADDSEVQIRRAGSNKEETMPADATTKIYPGDSIRIPERIF